MQAITIAIGKAGISFFAQQLLASKITQLLGTLVPPDKSLSVQQIDITYSTATNITVNLSQGSLSQFQPALSGSPVQQANGMFQLTINTGNFSAVYSWNEQYIYTYCYNDMGTIICDPAKNENNTYTYTQAFELLSLLVSLQFSFNSSNNAWQITVTGTQANATPGSPTIPKNSILQNQDPSDCGFSSHVDAATAQAISAIDFATPINALINGLIQTIPGSGNLGNGIVYNFSTGNDGLVFPNNDGIQMGITGGASYQGTAFAGPNPPSLPLPAPLSDTDLHHLNMYVSNYEVDALNWAFFQAGKLNTVVNAADLPDPGVLKVKTYVPSCPPLQPYAGRAMQAQIQPNSAPVTAFQLVYELSDAVMAVLQNQLSTAVYNDLTGLQGNSYASEASLLSDLNLNGITDSSDITKIETAAQSMGMVVTHDINYTLTILDFQPTQPTISFNVKRVDILNNLNLGVGGANNQAQTMQFGFTNASWTETFISSTIPGLEGGVFDGLWANAGEPQYANLMQDLGKNGVPLPIMQGFSFDFTNAELSIQNGYVSILANVNYNNP